MKILKIEEAVIYFQLIGYIAFQVVLEQRPEPELEQQELGQFQ